MDVARLRLAIPTVRFAPDGGTHIYDVTVTYGKLRWSVAHRFSEFLALYDALHQQGYEALPTPPAKTLTRPQDATTLEGRRIMLQNWMRALCTRPDTRTSSAFLEFLEFELQTSTVVPSVAPRLMGYCGESRFLVSDCVVVGSKKSIIAAYEESAHISRLGKVWSLVEQDELGAVTVWHMDAATPAAAPPLDSEELMFARMAHETTPCRVRGIFYHPQTGRIFCGLETGSVRVFTITNPSSTGRTADVPLELAPLVELPLHSEAVVSLRGEVTEPGRLLSVGYDGGVRILNCTTLDTVCGGRLQKRLTSGEHLSAGVLEPAADGVAFNSTRMFVGTDKGHVFIFHTQSNPPTFIVSLECKGPITALELAGCNLLVAHKYSLTIFRLSKDPRDPVVNRDMVLTPNLLSGNHCVDHCMTAILKLSGRTIRSIAISKTTPLLFLGHTRALSIWDCVSRTCVTVVRAHCNGIRRMHVLEDAQHVCLLTAGGDGLTKLWSIAQAEDYVPWTSPDATEEATAPNSSEKLLQKPCSLPSGSSNSSAPLQDDEDDCLMPVVSAVPHRH